jgi:hypothetical protein
MGELLVIRSLLGMLFKYLVSVSYVVFAVHLSTMIVHRFSLTILFLKKFTILKQEYRILKKSSQKLLYNVTNPFFKALKSSFYAKLFSVDLSTRAL